ncbi:hypothetical protein [Streptodolium elevatio]
MTETMEVPGWPVVTIEMSDADSVVVDGVRIPVPTGTDPRVVAVEQVTKTAQLLGRPVRCEAIEADGTIYPLMVAPDSTVTEAGPRISPKARKSFGRRRGSSAAPPAPPAPGRRVPTGAAPLPQPEPRPEPRSDPRSDPPMAPRSEPVPEQRPQWQYEGEPESVAPPFHPVAPQVQAPAQAPVPPQVQAPVPPPVRAEPPAPMPVSEPTAPAAASAPAPAPASPAPPVSQQAPVPPLAAAVPPPAPVAPPAAVPRPVPEPVAAVPEPVSAIPEPAPAAPEPRPVPEVRRATPPPPPGAPRALPVPTPEQSQVLRGIRAAVASGDIDSALQRALALEDAVRQTAEDPERLIAAREVSAYVTMLAGETDRAVGLFARAAVDRVGMDGLSDPWATRLAKNAHYCWLQVDDVERAFEVGPLVLRAYAAVAPDAEPEASAARHHLDALRAHVAAS